MTANDMRARFEWLAFTERATRKMIEMIPDDRWDFRPAEGSRSIGELVQHLYGAERATFRAFQRGSMTKEDYDRDAGPAVGSQADALELAESAHDIRSEVLGALTDSQLAATVSMFYGDFSAEQVLGFAYDEHWHHRGQLSVYLRLLGLAPPLIYGEG